MHKASLNKQLVQRFYQHIWNERAFSKIPALLNDSFTCQGSLEPEKMSLAEFKADTHKVHNALSNYHCRIETLISNDEQVFAN